MCRMKYSIFICLDFKSDVNIYFNFKTNKKFVYRIQ